jgi:hypothetical protein
MLGRQPHLASSCLETTLARCRLTLLIRMRNEYTRSDSLAWSNPGSNFWTMHASYERAAIRSQDDQDALLLLPFLCVCIYHMLWTYIFVWGAIHGILSILPLAETKRTSKTKGNRHQVHVDMPPSLNKRPFFPMRKAHGIIRDTAFDQILSQTLASHVELAMKGYLLLPPRSGLFAPVLILIVPRSLLLDALTPEAFAWVTFGERVRARSSYSHSRPVCVPWTSPSSRQHIIANVLQKFQCRSTADSVHNYTRCYTPSPDAGELSESGKTGIFKFELLSVPIRSRAGNNSTSSHSRPVESSSQQLRRSFDLYSAAGKITTQMQQSNNHNGGETSDEEEKDKEQPKKRKISAEVPEFRLPCIFHVFDQRGLTRDPKWKYCNPQTTYPDPSALS